MVGTLYQLAPDALVMRPRRRAWVVGSVDGNSRPFVIPDKLATVAGVTGLAIAGVSLDMATKYQPALTRLHTGAGESLAGLATEPSRRVRRLEYLSHPAFA